MDAEQFAYWLQGFVELNDGTPPTAAKWESIREHLATVFTKVTTRVEFAPLAPDTERAVIRYLTENAAGVRRLLTGNSPRRIC